MSIVVKNNILWVGQRDWEVRDFHGTEYKTLRGSSYNSYLIREEKNVLIDTVDHKFSREFVQNLRREIDLADLDYIVINHAEEDHAGALTELMMQIPDTPIYCTANAIDSINGHHHHPEWNFHVVKTGDTLDGTVAKLAMRQPFVLFKGLTFQKLCLPGAFRPGDHHNKMLRPG
ncbi:MBL fold metallo-hydrolase, partial [Klebsiella pneumoniae]|uniref:MBL fold metallo-hydrolase n=1 Tax=Klebsiella pneumoniae TaxID=573 RepID=UPI0025A2CC94